MDHAIQSRRSESFYSSEAIESQPLLFGNSLNICIDKDPDILAQRLSQHYKLLDYGPRPGYQGKFLHRSFTAFAGDLAVTCGYASPLLGRMGQMQDRGSINLMRLGAVTYTAAGHEYHLNPKRPLFFGPILEYNYQSDHYNGVVFDISISRLRSTISAMLGVDLLSKQIVTELSCFKTVAMDGTRTSQLLRRLAKSLAMLEDHDCILSLEIPFLQLDDLIYRHLALLLVPQALFERAISTKNLSHRDQVFEELLEWIQANLQSTIRLTDLEQRSGYSSRTLQKQFQVRFGCGPIQWVRRQRLKQARRALLDPAPADTVTSIARRFGFNSLAVFSRDYTLEYGINPSESLMTGRSNRL